MGIKTYKASVMFNLIENLLIGTLYATNDMCIQRHVIKLIGYFLKYQEVKGHNCDMFCMGIIFD